MDNTELIIGLKNGRLTAFRQLFRDYYTIIRRFLSIMLADNELAKDVTQNIFMKVWLTRQNLDESKSMRNYLYVLAKNEAINILNKRKKYHTQEVSDEDLVENDPFRALELNEMTDRVRKRVEGMPAQRRLIFRMSRYKHLSNGEIAAKLNISVRTVEKHIELALKDIRGIVS